MTRTPPPARRLPTTAATGQPVYAGASAVVHAQLIVNPARANQLLTTHLPVLADILTDLGVRRWWIKRHRDTIRVEADQYLSLFLQLTDPSAFGPVAARLGEFAAEMAARGLPAELFLAPYHPHPGRYGHGPALETAAEVFATDSTAAISQLRTAEHTGIPAQALATASMAQLAAAFGPSPRAGYQQLLSCLAHHSDHADRALTNAARHMADPTGGHRNLRALWGETPSPTRGTPATMLSGRTTTALCRKATRPAYSERSCTSTRSGRSAWTPTSSARPTMPPERRPCAVSPCPVRDDSHPRTSFPQP